MKYANLLYTGGKAVNMGDVLLTLSINYLYEKMGIGANEIVRIPYKELHNYIGEKVILPIVSAFVGYHDGKHITCFSPAIIPVFLSFNIMTTILNDEDVAYLKKYAPIGCRDTHTYSIMCKYDIPAYVNGCISILMEFTERKKRKEQDILWVDVPSELELYAPDEIKNHKKVNTQIRAVNDIKDIEIENRVYDYYLEYFENAKLVITSRLHCAIPCIMAGIPVIFVGGGYDYRFSWMDNYITFYDESEYDIIDWNPGINTDLFGIKNNMMGFVIGRLSYIKHYLDYSFEMTNLYFTPIREYKIRVFENILKTFRHKAENLLANKDKMRYAIWGIGQLSDMLYDYISRNYRKCIFQGMFDNSINGKYAKIDIKKSDEIFHSKIDLIIITPATIVGLEKLQYKEKLRLAQIDYIFGTDYSISRIGEEDK